MNKIGNIFIFIMEFAISQKRLFFLIKQKTPKINIFEVFKGD
jgi:hypothetical protein